MASATAPEDALREKADASQSAAAVWRRALLAANERRRRAVEKDRMTAAAAATLPEIERRRLRVKEIESEQLEEQRVQQKQRQQQLLALLDTRNVHLKTKERLVAEHLVIQEHKRASAAADVHIEELRLLQQQPNITDVPVPAPGVVPVPAPSSFLGYLRYKGTDTFFFSSS